MGANKIVTDSEGERYSSKAELILTGAAIVLLYFTLFVSNAGKLEPTNLPDSTALSPEHARAILDESRVKLREGKFEESLALVRQLHEAFPESHIYLEQMALLFQKLDRPADEADALEKYMLRSPVPLDACPRIGVLYEKLGQPEKAESAFERCLGYDPRNPDVILYLARIRERAGQLDAAEKMYREGLALSPNYPDLSVGLARIFLQRGDVPQAKRLLEAVLQREPRHSDALEAVKSVSDRENRPGSKTDAR